MNQPGDGRSAWTAVADVATIVIALCAVTVTVIALRSQPSQPASSTDPPDRVLSEAEWSQVAAQGHRLGPTGAPVRIVEFADYECPFCRRLENTLRAVRAAYPREVSLVYRNYPLPCHGHAYRAARLAECAADQGRFVQAHDLLFDADLTALKAGAFAHQAQVPDSARFVTCSSRTDSVPEIRTDIEAAQQLQVDGVPTLIVQGTMLAMAPDSATLFALVDQLLQGGKR